MGYIVRQLNLSQLSVRCNDEKSILSLGRQGYPQFC
jgi:hypothetical protein